MPTLKELLNAFGKASARNAVPNVDVFSEIFPPNAAGDATQNYFSPCDGWIWVRFTACRWAIANGESFGGLNFETKETVGVDYGAFFPVQKGRAYSLSWKLADTGFAKFWLYPNKTES